MGKYLMDQGHGAPIDYIHKECGHVFKTRFGLFAL